MADNAAFLSNWRQGQQLGAEAQSSNQGAGVSGFFSNLGSNINTTFNDTLTRLPLSGSEPQEPEWFQLSRFERLTGFGMLLLGSFICFGLGFLLLPVLTLNPRKFVMLWTLGSLLFFLSFGVLQGPVAYITHLTSRERLPFTVMFVACIVGTIYTSVVLKSTILSLIMGLLEFIGVLWYTVSYFPFGAQTMGYIGGYATRMIGFT